MTVMTDLNAITPTTTSKGVALANAMDLISLVNLAKQHIGELKVVLSQIIAIYPNTGGDTTNHAALVSVLAELA